ncbi:protein penguin [Drosophila grimshawi]|uniref:GH24934 n=1 Tax=Drosophila grimshawi TaxID=7222 RepID=B4JP18_DROGR|nr:protein penguin [Drosophila grimshawi]EDV92461.1 GH24934 [Drosophila grimshawi]
MLNAAKPRQTAKTEKNDTKRPLFKKNAPAKPGNKFKANGKRGFEGKNSSNKFATGKPHPGKGATPATDEKQDWTKFKQEKKDLKLKRKSTRDTYEITQEVKKIYEQVKCRRTQNKDELVQQMYKILNVGDTISKVAKAHDTARVLQCMLKHATPALRIELSDKLMPHAVDMCQSKYAHFCVQRMLKYGAPATKSKLVDGLMGNIVRLSSHNIASKILDHIYLNASEKQRRYMRQEFYSDLYKKSKDDGVHTLSDTYKEAANMKASIMGAVKANLEHIANKNLVDNSLVHAVILEFMQATDEEKLEETMSALSPLIPHMLTTKDGTEAAIICFYKSTPKNRRAILKNIKEHLLKIALHEHGHVFLIALLNALDDTKATKKAIYDNLHGDLKALVANQYGRRVVQWLVAPGDTTCFHPDFIKTIEEGLAFGKKDKQARRKEILEQIEEPIAMTIAEDAGFWLSNSHIGLVTADILNHITGENYEKAVAALAPVITQADWRVSAVPSESAQNKKRKPQDVEAIIDAATRERRTKKQLNGAAPPPVSSDEESDAEEGTPAKKSKEDQPQPKVEEELPSVVGIEEAGMHHVLKKLIKNDQKHETHPLGAHLLQQLSSDVLKIWLGINRACYVLVKLVEESPTLLSTCRDLVGEQELLQLLLAQKTSGAKLLASKLNLKQ